VPLDRLETRRPVIRDCKGGITVKYLLPAQRTISLRSLSPPFPAFIFLSRGQYEGKQISCDLRHGKPENERQCRLKGFAHINLTLRRVCKCVPQISSEKEIFLLSFPVGNETICKSLTIHVIRLIAVSLEDRV